MRASNILINIAGKALVTAFLVYLLVFVAFAVLPLDPARSLLGPVADQQAVAALNARFGFDAPLPERLWRVTFLALQGDFGQSITYGEPVVPLVARSLVTTFVRLGLAAIVGFILAWLFVPWIIEKNFRVGRLFMIAAAGVPSFVLLAILLMIFGAALGVPPSQANGLYNVLAVLVAALAVFSAVSLTIFDQMDFRTNPGRPAQFLLMLHAPEARILHILQRGALPSALAALANSIAPALTALTFSEFVFGLDGFSIMFMRACDRGDIAIVAFGSLSLAVILVALQGIAQFVAMRADARLA